MSTDESYDLKQFNPDHLNQIAKLLSECHVFLPLNVRYQAAAAALNYVHKWTKTAFDFTPIDYVQDLNELKIGIQPPNGPNNEPCRCSCHYEQGK